MAVVSCRDLGTNVRALIVDHDPGAVATDAPKGSLIIDSAGDWYHKTDDGSTTNVTKILDHNSAGGLQGGTTDEYYHSTSAEHTELLRYKADVNLAGTLPAVSDFSAWAVGDRGIGVGTGGEIYLVYKDGSSSIKSILLT